MNHKHKIDKTAKREEEDVKPIHCKPWGHKELMA